MSEMAEMQGNGESIPDSEKESQLYKVEVISFKGGRTITVLHMEHEDRIDTDLQEMQESTKEYAADDQNPIGMRVLAQVTNSELNPEVGKKGGDKPHNWKKIIQEQVEKASVVFVEYFPAEIYREAGSNTVFRWMVDRYMKQLINPFFHTVSALAGISGKDVGVADIANRVIYELYEMDSSIVSALEQGDYKGHSTGISPLEIQAKSVIDARRLLTAEGLAQDIKNRAAGSNILYIAPPAHAARIAHYLRLIERDDKNVEKKAMQYLRYPGLDKNVRLYSSRRSRMEWEAFLLSEPDNYKPTPEDTTRICNSLYPIVESLVEEKKRQNRDGWRKGDDRISLTLEELLLCRRAVFDNKIAEARRILANDGSWNRYSYTPIKPK